MHRFPAKAKKRGIASAGCLTDDMAEVMGRSILVRHESGPSHAGPLNRLMADIPAGLGRVFSALHDRDLGDQALGILAKADVRLSGLAGVLRVQGRRIGPAGAG